MVRPEGYTQPVDVWESLHLAKERGLVLEAQVEKVSYPERLDTCVWELSFPEHPGVTGIVPFSESGLEDKALMNRLVGQRVFVAVKGLDRENGVVACSRSAALDALRERVFATLQEGQLIDCVVKAVLPRDRANGLPERLLVDVGGGVLAEVPRSKATRSLAASLRELYRPGQAVRARVLSVDREKGEVKVSLVDAEPDPWQGLVFRRGEVVAGTVVQVVPEKALVFVEVRPGVVGIAPPPLRGELRRGDRASCAVASFDPQAKKLRLRVRSKLA
ncbi:hypothetical protein [Desulfothermobacter acidiphilus]|uniref:hypothetical protein n=1 Tax=Desulfothermobacter acidiphilus TaxID=1938353 RepID=UPI003F8A31E3